MLIKQLELLVSLNGSKTYSEAAEKRKCSQASVSKAVQGLEATLGFRIIEHGTDGVSFTQKGRLALEKASLIHNEMQNIKDIRYSFFHDLGGHFTMGCSTHTYNVLLADIIVKLQKNYPDLYISLEECDSREIISNVADRTHPIGLMLTNDIDGNYYQSTALSRNLRCTPIFEEPMRIIAGVKHPLAYCESITLRELLSQSTFVSRYTPTEQYELFLRQNGYRDKISVALDVHTQRKIVSSSSRHIAIIPDSGVESSNHQYNQELRTITLSDYTPKGAVCWVEHALGYSKQEEQIIALIKEHWGETMWREGIM